MKFFVGGLILLIAISGCNNTGIGLAGIVCENVTTNYEISGNTITLKSTGDSCNFQYTTPYVTGNNQIYNNGAYFVPEKALKIDGDCMKKIGLTIPYSYPIIYSEIVMDKNQNSYGCIYHNGT